MSGRSKRSNVLGEFIGEEDVESVAARLDILVEASLGHGGHALHRVGHVRHLDRHVKVVMLGRASGRAAGAASGATIQETTRTSTSKSPSALTSRTVAEPATDSAPHWSFQSRPTV